MSIAEAIGVLGFALAAVLGYFEYRRARANPDIRLDMDWIMGGGDIARLRVVATNQGGARGSARDIVFAQGPTINRETTFYYMALKDELPVMLDPGHFARFTVQLDPNGTETFTRNLLDGAFTHAILIDQDSNHRAFPIPDQPTDTENRVSTYGRVAKR